MPPSFVIITAASQTDGSFNKLYHARGACDGAWVAEYDSIPAISRLIGMLKKDFFLGEFAISNLFFKLYIDGSLLK